MWFLALFLLISLHLCMGISSNNPSGRSPLGATGGNKQIITILAAKRTTPQPLPRTPRGLDDFDARAIYEEPSSMTKKLIPLLKQANRVVTSFWFVGLIWHAFGIYSELSEQFPRTPLASIHIGAVKTLIVANVLGLLGSLLAMQRWKAFLKAVVSVNIFREWAEAIVNIFLALSSSNKAFYQGKLLANMWWSMACLYFVRSRWVDQFTTPSTYKTAGWEEEDRRDMRH